MKPQPKLRGFFSGAQADLFNKPAEPKLPPGGYRPFVKTKPKLNLRIRPDTGPHYITEVDPKAGTFVIGNVPKPRILNRAAPAPEGVTAWYPGTLKPMRVGVYERTGPNPEYPYSWWNGVFWCIGGKTPDDAMKPLHKSLPGCPQPDKWFVCPSHVQDASWRGLTREHASEERAHNAPD